MARHFYRCAGCLEVVALDGDRLPMSHSYTVATCANCGQHFDRRAELLGISLSDWTPTRKVESR